MSGWHDNTPQFYDQVVVDRVLAGKDRGRLLHRAERLEVARALVARDDGVTALATAIGCNHQDAHRLLHEARTTPRQRRPGY